LPLRYSRGQSDTHRSNTPVVARNSAKNTHYPCGVAAAPSSQRTCMRAAQRVHDLRLSLVRASLSTRRQRLASCFTHRVSVPPPRKATPASVQRQITTSQLPDSG
jgi:hypothetical protein